MEGIYYNLILVSGCGGNWFLIARAIRIGVPVNALFTSVVAVTVLCTVTSLVLAWRSLEAIVGGEIASLGAIAFLSLFGLAVAHSLLRVGK